MKTSVFVGVSVDGFIARADGTFDFLDAGGNEPHGYEEFIATVDTIVMGRKTFETVLGFGSWPFQKPVVVLSSQPLDLSTAASRGGRVEQMAGPPAQVAAALSDRGVQHVYLDGGLTIQGFLRAGLVTRLIVTRVPVLIGSGIPLFGTLLADVPLRHVATKTFRGGLVQTEYGVIAS
jgi:dihydrofolate reductase